MPENLNDWLGLVVPEETTNYIPNPSFELGQNGWTGTNTALGRAGAYAHMGGIGMSLQATNATNSYITATLLTTSGIGDWTVSVWMYATQGITLVLQNGVSLATLAFATHPGDGKWHRLVATALSVANGTQLKVYVSNPLSSGWAACYVDGFQLENKAYATSYCDGDQPECRWAGREHQSISRRPDNAKSGGRYMSFRSLGVNVRGITGAGAPPMQHITEQYAVLPGSEYQQTAVQPRVITLTCQAIGTSRETLHVLRQTLLAAMVKAGGSSKEPIWLYYQRDADHITQIGVYYEGGMELGEITRFLEPFPIRLIAYDPYWQSDHDLSADFQMQSLVGGNGIAMRSVDQPSDTPSTWGWNFMNYTAGDNVSLIRVIETSPDGMVYVAGTFTQIGGVAANNIAYWDGNQWNAMGSGVAADTVNAIAFNFNGSAVYIGGSFTTIGGVGAARFAIWTPGGTYSAVQNYTSGAVMCLAVRPLDGVVYIGGSMAVTRSGLNFTGLDTYIGYTSLTSGFDALTAVNSNGVQGITISGGSATVNGMCFHAGNLYFCGSFTQIAWSGGIPAGTPVAAASGVAYWPLRSLATMGTSPQAPVAIATGLGTVTSANDMVESGDGRYVYMAGAFTIGGTYHSVGAWDGSTWSGDVVQGKMIISAWNGAISEGTKLKVDPNGFLWALGRLTSISSSLAFALGAAGGYVGGAIWDWVQNIARFNGSEWVPVDGMFYGGKGAGSAQHQYQLAMGFTRRGDLMIGSARQPTGLLRPGTLTGSVPINVDAPTPIKIWATNTAGEHYLSRITNHSTGRELSFKNPNLGIWLRFAINTEIGKQSVSFGNRNAADFMTGDSALALFWLQPGENKLTFSAPTANQATPHSTSALGVVYFRERLLSIDAIPRDNI